MGYQPRKGYTLASNTESKQHFAGETSELKLQVSKASIGALGLAHVVTQLSHIHGLLWLQMHWQTSDLYTMTSDGDKTEKSQSFRLNLAVLFFSLQLRSQGSCTSASWTCPTTACTTSSTACWRTSTSYGSSRWRTTRGSATTTSTTWSTGSSTTPASSTRAWSAPSRGSSGAGAWRTTSRPTTASAPRINRPEGWTWDRGEQTLRRRRWWGRWAMAKGSACLSRWRRRRRRTSRSSGWVRISFVSFVDQWTGSIWCTGGLWMGWRTEYWK